ncbi:DoxX family protein [Emticicia sp. 17c]|uniref:DoxX family protein n=1 Tax=Emticicia sp. 17c TaxID=3127704 RepID=UPI00301CAA0D
MIQNSITFVLLRLAVGMSMFGHGLVRVPKLAVFSNWMVEKFDKSFLPNALVVPFSYVLPVLELAIGVLLLIGLFTRQALITGAIAMILLIFGSSMVEDWGAIPSQLIHTFLFAVLLSYTNYNSYAADNLLKKQD